MPGESTGVSERTINQIRKNFKIWGKEWRVGIQDISEEGRIAIRVKLSLYDKDTDTRSGLGMSFGTLDLIEQLAAGRDTWYNDDEEPHTWINIPTLLAHRYRKFLEEVKEKQHG